MRGEGAVIGVVLSLFNKRVSDCLKEGALRELKKAGVDQFEWVEVPGVVEIPLAAQRLLQEKHCQAVIVLGAVIKGETFHFEACCRLVEMGCMQVQLKAGRPIVFGVLMTHNLEQALARAFGGAKGCAAAAAVRTALHLLPPSPTPK